jgi:DNA primase
MVQYQDRETIRLLLNYSDKAIESQKLSDFLVHELDDVEFTNPAYKEIYLQFRNGLERGDVINNEYFIRNGSDEVRRVVTSLITSRHDVSTHWGDKYKIFIPKEQDVLEKMAMSNVLRLKFRMVQRMMEDNLAEIKKAETADNMDALDEALGMQEGLKQAERELAGLLGIVVAK